MRLHMKIKAGASAVGLFTDIVAAFTAGALNPASVHLDGLASGLLGTYKPRMGVNGNALYFELANGGVIQISHGASSLMLKSMMTFDWVTLTGTTFTTGYENAANATIGNTQSLQLSANPIIVLNVLPNSVGLYGTSWWANATASGWNSSHHFQLGVVTPVDPLRFDSVNAPLARVFTPSGTPMDKSFSGNGSAAALNNDVGMSHLGVQNSTVLDSTGVASTGVSPLMFVFPGIQIVDANNEQLILAGRRPLGDTYDAGSRRWMVNWFGHSYGSYSTDGWQANSIAAELL